MKSEPAEVVKHKPVKRTQSLSDPKKVKRHHSLTLPQVSRVLDDLSMKLKPQVISKRYSVSTQYVNRIKTYLLELHKAQEVAQTLSIDAIKVRAEDGFIRMVDRVQRSITTGDIFRASLKDKVWAIGVLYDKHRLATGQSTSNIKTLAMIVERMDQGRRYPSVDGPRPEPIPAEATVKDAPSTKPSTIAEEPLI